MSMSPRPCDLLIVAAETDSLASALRSFCADQGYSAELTDVATAARLFSISVEGGVAVVQPDIPIFLRVPQPKSNRQSFDEAFIAGECFSTLFAVASLCKSEVI